MRRINDEGILGFVIDHPRPISDTRAQMSVRTWRIAAQISVVVAGSGPYIDTRVSDGCAVRWKQRRHTHRNAFDLHGADGLRALFVWRERR
jgi:hypothetical protein